MIHHDAPLCQDFLKIAVGHRIADAEEDSVKNDLPQKLNTFYSITLSASADQHWSSPQVPATSRKPNEPKASDRAH